MAAIQEDIKSIRDEVVVAMRSGNRALAEKKQEEQKAIMTAAGVHPGRVLMGPLLQFPVFISFFVGIRRMTTSNPELLTGGTAWFTDLSTKDPTYILPIVAGATLLAMTELGGESGNKMTPQMKMAMRGVVAISVPLTAWLPSALFCYWIPNNIFSVGLNAASRHPAMKRAMGLVVDPASIPGTTAAKKLERAQGTIRTPVDPAIAAASYKRAKNSYQSSASDKPVLFSSKADALRSKKASATGKEAEGRKVA